MTPPTNGATSLSPNALVQQALKLHQTGKLEEAQRMYETALMQQPDHAQALHYLGVIFDQFGDHIKAAELISQSIALQPNDPEAYNNLGLAHKGKGEWHQAVTCYKHALKLDPNYPEVMYNMGIALHHSEQYEEAIDWFNQALLLNPNYAEVYCSMGRSYSAIGKHAMEVECCEKAVKLKPTFAEAYGNMGVAYAELGNFDEAERCFRQALDVNPKFVDGLFNLSVCLQEQGKTEEAEVIYRSVLAKQPEFMAALHNISSVLQQQGKVEEARHHFNEALAAGKTDALKAKLALLTRPIFASTDDILSERNTIETAVTQLMQEGCRLKDPYLEVGTINFYHAFHGLNNRHLNTLIGNFFLQSCEELAFTSLHVESVREAGGLIRIGILSSFFKEHTITKLMQGIVEKLPRDRFEVVLLAVQGAEDFMSHTIKSVADYVISIPKHLDTAREEISQQQLDILFYADIGMEAFTYYLAFSRLARVQCVTWGHPDTSGIPSIDYFISNQDIETENSQQAYSEQLVCLNALPTYYYPPMRPESPKTRAFFRLPEEGNLYLCPQSLFKFHPDFDAVLAEILRRDPTAHLVLIDGNHKHWNILLTERFAASIPDVADRILFLPRMSGENFLSLLLLADAMLDPIHFGGGNTSYEAFAMGVPIVTLPGEFMRGRVTYGCYKQMGMADLVARDTAEYVALAHRLANDKHWQQEIREKIRTSSAVLYENQQAIDELAEFFTKAHEAALNNTKITTWPVNP